MNFRHITSNQQQIIKPVYQNFIKYFILCIIMIVFFSFCFVIYQQSISFLLDDVSKNMGINSSSQQALVANAAQSDIKKTITPNITLTELNVSATSPIEVFGEENTENVQLASKETGSKTITVNLTRNIVLGGELKKLAETGRIKISIIVHVHAYYWNFSATGVNWTNRVIVANETISSYSGASFSEYSWASTSLIDLKTYANDVFSINFLGTNTWKNGNPDGESSTGTNSEGKIEFKKIQLWYGAVYKDPNGKDHGKPNDISLPTVAFKSGNIGSTSNETGLIEDGGQKKVRDVNTSPTVTANLVTDYYFTEWTGKDSYSTNAIKTNKLLLTLKAPNEI
ncbi:MAG: hypothetical protein LBF68_06680, partial [Christensenellaceae bacterium]|nr:hypothetical protein [Christensenellaceae bacterium]